jgi:hypothetical protein
VLEANPYVSLLTDSALKVVGADMSKYGESHPSGWHDQSIFYFKKKDLFDALTESHCALWKNGRYIVPGGELSLLYTFHLLYNKGMSVSVYETSYPTLSFNTIEEVLTIQKEINAKWTENAKNRS